MVEADIECMNKNFNYPLNVLEVAQTEEFKEVAEKRALLRGITIDRGKFRVRIVVGIDCKRIGKRCKAIEE